MPEYTITPGTPVFVRRAGESVWTPHRTTRLLSFAFADRQVVDNGGHWMFAYDGWELKVLPSNVVGRPPKPSRPGKSSDSFGSSKGRGSSRRRAMRATKSRR